MSFYLPAFMRLLVAALIAGLPPSTQALDLLVMGGIDLTRPDSYYSGVSGGKGSGTGPAIAALVRFNLGPGLELETGALYVTQKYMLIISAVNNNFSQQTLQLPVLLRYRLVPWVSVGAGVYEDVGVGNVTDDDGTGVASGSYGTYLLKANHFGLLVSATFEYPVAQNKSVVVDGRYAYGVENVSIPNGIPGQPVIDTQLNEIQVLAGMKFQL